MILAIQNDSSKKNLSFTSVFQEGAELAKNLGLNSRRRIELDCFKEFLKQDGKDYLAVLSHDVFKSENVDVPLSNLGSGSVEGIEKELTAMRKLDNPEKLDNLIEKLNYSDDFSTKNRAAKIIHKMNNQERAVALMEKHIMGEEENAPRRQAASNAGRFSDPDLAVSMVKKYIKHPDIAVQDGAALSAGAVADAKKAEALIDWIMKQPKIDIGVKGEAIKSIKYMNDTKIRDSLIKKYADHQDKAIKASIAGIVGLLSDSREAVP